MKKTNLNDLITTHNGFIKHAGIVTKKTKDSIIVSLIGNINCAGCNAKSACGISDTDVKTVEVFDHQDSYKINESVAVIMENNTGFKAVFFAYLFPFILLILTLIISLNFFEEWKAGLLSLFVLAPYFLVLYFSKNYLQKELIISILKLHKR